MHQHLYSTMLCSHAIFILNSSTLGIPSFHLKILLHLNIHNFLGTLLNYTITSSTLEMPTVYGFCNFFSFNLFFRALVYIFSIFFIIFILWERRQRIEILYRCQPSWHVYVFPLMHVVLLIQLKKIQTHSTINY